MPCSLKCLLLHVALVSEVFIIEIFNFTLLQFKLLFFVSGKRFHVLLVAARLCLRLPFLLNALWCISWLGNSGFFDLQNSSTHWNHLGSFRKYMCVCFTSSDWEFIDLGCDLSIVIRIKPPGDARKQVWGPLAQLSMQIQGRAHWGHILLLQVAYTPVLGTLSVKWLL